MPLIARLRILASWAPVLGLALGCVTAPEPHDPAGAGPEDGPGETLPDAPPSPEHVLAEGEFLDAGMALEMSGKVSEALDHYGTALAPGAGVTPRLHATAQLRSAACLIMLGRKDAAREFLQAVLGSASVAPDDDVPAPIGGSRSPLRVDAEHRLRECGGDPVAFYASICDAHDDRAAWAVVCLARLGGPHARELVAAVSQDPKADAPARAAAGQELADWGRRSRPRR